MFNVSDTATGQLVAPLNRQSRIAIVGAGLAGLTLARHLRQLEVDAVLFEKSRGPGGRMSSKRLPAAGNGGSADIGAQYFTLRNPAFRAFLEHYAEGAWQPWAGLLHYQQPVDGQWQLMRADERFVGVPRMTAITRALAEGLELKAEVRIEKLRPGQQRRWALEDTRGGLHGEFDAVVITAPPVQTRDLLADSGLGALAADPAIDGARMLACWTAVVHFPDGTDAAADGFRPASEILHWAGNNSSKPGRSDQGEWWVLHGEPEWSEAHTETDPEAVTSALLEEFRRTCSVTAPHGDIVHHRWLYARPDDTAPVGHRWFPDAGIAVIGDWLQGGRVEGAFDSAISLLQCWLVKQ